MSFRLGTALAGALAAACFTVSPADAGTACGPSGYAYAGVQPAQTGYGVSARISALATPVVESGHVAGWVGVGGPGQGPGGTSEWIQVGLNALPGTGNVLYYEIMRPGAGQPEYGELDTNVAAGRPVKLAVLETAGSPGAWRIWVDGKAVGATISLPGSHGALAPMAMGESWDGGQPACNRYNYRFDGVSIASAPGGGWQLVRSGSVLQDSGYRVIKRADGAFDATMASTPLPAETRAVSGVTPKPKPAPAARASAPSTSVQTVTLSSSPQVIVHAVAAAAPLRKGFVPAPTEEALGATSQPVVEAAPESQPDETVDVVTVDAPVVEDDTDLGLGVTLSYDLSQ